MTARQRTRRGKNKTWEEVLEELRRSFQQPASKKPRLRQGSYRYAPSLITYLDVLGMRDLLASSGKDANKVGDVLDLFTRFSKVKPEQKELWRSSFVNFSDLAVRIVPLLTEANQKYRLGCFFHELFDLAYIQVNLIHRGILLRGAMTVGEICHTRGVIFGNGLVEAYDLERTVAVYPRIVVSDFAMYVLKSAPLVRAEGNSFREEMSYLNVREDYDGKWFLDYLDWMHSNSDDWFQYSEFLRRHKVFIEDQRDQVGSLSSGVYRQSRLKKLRWLIRLHNDHVSTRNTRSFYTETGTDLATLKVKPWKELRS